VKRREDLMSNSERRAYFEKELNERIRDFALKRRRDKSKAFKLKILAVVFPAAITVLLGAKVGTVVSGVLQNVALLLGAIITVLNAVEAFYDHRSLWIRRTVTLARLYEVRRDLGLSVAGAEDGDIDSQTLDRLVGRYDGILDDDLKAWLKLREDTSTTTKTTKAKNEANKPGTSS
jgi:hypothetical protein